MTLDHGTGPDPIDVRSDAGSAPPAPPTGLDDQPPIPIDAAPPAAPTPSTSRWEESPPVWLRLAAGVGGPLLAGLLWYACWTWVDTWLEAPSGDTGFAWMPLALGLAGVAAFLGLGALIPRARGNVVAGSVAVWLLAAGPLYLLVPSYGSNEGFPTSSFPLMLTACALSSLPWVALVLPTRRAALVALGIASLVALGAIAGMSRISADRAAETAEMEATGYACHDDDAAVVEDVVAALPGVQTEMLMEPEIQDGQLCMLDAPVTGDLASTTSAARAWLEGQGYAVTTTPHEDYSVRNYVLATADGRPTITLRIESMPELGTSVLIAVGDQPLPDR